jgi:hypothetical protein
MLLLWRLLLMLILLPGRNANRTSWRSNQLLLLLLPLLMHQLRLNR